MNRVVVLLSIIMLAGCSGNVNKSCNNSALYGYVNICLPEIKGMTECRTNTNVQQIIAQYLTTGPVLGYYLNDETYSQIEKLSEITFDNYFMIYGDYQRENYRAVPTDLEVIEKNLEQTLFEGKNFEQISSKVEEAYGTITAGQPALLEKYIPQSNVRTMIVLMKYKNESTESSILSAINFILLKNRVLNLAYYVSYNGGKSIDILKEKNNEVVAKLISAN
ncbi:MAG: hypothetical protein LBE56_05660 [Tannerella sp.]|nr:hypothetical protein [Tannerella sp.]